MLLEKSSIEEVPVSRRMLTEVFKYSINFLRLCHLYLLNVTQNLMEWRGEALDSEIKEV